MWLVYLRFDVIFFSALISFHYYFFKKKISGSAGSTGFTCSGRSGSSWKLISRFWFWFREVMTYMSVGFYFLWSLERPSSVRDNGQLCSFH